jgi:uncharacterized protein
VGEVAGSNPVVPTIFFHFPFFLLLETMNSTGIFLTADWRCLAMLHYEVDPSLLSELVPVPAGTELDRWNGKVFVSLIGFRFLKTKVLGISIPFHSDFDEINLRLYVRRRENNESRSDVVFIKEIVQRRAIAIMANALYNKRYVCLRTSHEIQPQNETEFTVEYGWQYGKVQNKIAMTTAGPGKLAEDGSLEQFLAEHHWGYTSQKDGGTVEYRVAHPAWKIWKVRDAGFEGDTTGLCGSKLAAVLRGSPSLAFVAEGSEASISWARKL